MKNEPKPKALAIGDRVTHRNAPERAGTIVSELDGLARVRYDHATEELLPDGKPRTVPTYADYHVADLTIVS